METPNENTVTAFEIEEEGLSVALSNAIEDQRAVVEYLTHYRDSWHRLWMAEIPVSGSQAAHYEKVLNRAVERQFQAMRVLGLLEAAREREAGGVA